MPFPPLPEGRLGVAVLPSGSFLAVAGSVTLAVGFSLLGVVLGGGAVAEAAPGLPLFLPRRRELAFLGALLDGSAAELAGGLLSTALDGEGVEADAAVSPGLALF